MFDKSTPVANNVHSVGASILVDGEDRVDSGTTCNCPMHVNYFKLTALATAVIAAAAAATAATACCCSAPRCDAAVRFRQKMAPR